MCVHFPRSVTRADLSCCHSVVFHICISGLSINYSEKSYSIVALFNFLENSGANVCQNSTLHIWYVKSLSSNFPSIHTSFLFQWRCRVLNISLQKEALLVVNVSSLHLDFVRFGNFLFPDVQSFALGAILSLVFFSFSLLDYRLTWSQKGECMSS